MSSNIILNLTDLENLTLEELQEEYAKLYQLYNNLRQTPESDCQLIHELKRNLSVSKAAEVHLNQELEIITGNQNIEIDKIHAKYQQDIDEIRKKNLDLEQCNSNLEQNIEKLNLKSEGYLVKINQLELKHKSQVNTNLINIESDKAITLERENIELLKKLDDTQDELDKANRIIQEKERQIELFKEQLQCVEENLLSKREELEEKGALLESTQEQMVEMNSELAMLKTAPENIDRKGNSLFAEVDDQRQVMKQMLATQKKKYLQMKKVYNESEYEIRRLKRENAAIHSELKACASIYLNAEKTYKDKLNKRILQLLKQNQDLEKKLQNREDQLVDIAHQTGVNWLDSMLTFCKNETRELKAELNSLRLEKSALDHNLRDSQQELSKWRFEALKSRCIIIDREALLEKNCIQYKQFQPYEIHLSSNELENAEPYIFAISTSLSTDNEKKNYLNVPNILNGTTILNNIKNESVQSSQLNNSSISEINHCDDSHISLDSSYILNNSNVGFASSNIKFENDKSLQDELSELCNRDVKEEFKIYEDIPSIDIKFNKTETYNECSLKKEFKVFKDTSCIDIELNQFNRDEKCVESVSKYSAVNKHQSKHLLQMPAQSIKLEYQTPEVLQITPLKRKCKEDISDVEFKKPIIKLHSESTLCENQGQKSVTFDEETKNSPKILSENNNKTIKTRFKSNIVMRKIVIKSSTEKKCNS